MNFRELIIKTFQREKIDRVVWQPRLEHWYYVNRKRGTLPSRYRGKSLMEIYRDLNASKRYWYYQGPFYLQHEYDQVKIESRKDGARIMITMDTPEGRLQQIEQLGEWECSQHFLEYPVKTPGDMKIMEFILKNQRVVFNKSVFQQAEKEVGEYGVTQFFNIYPYAPLQRLIICLMGFEPTIYALTDNLPETERLMDIMEKADDELFNVLAGSPVRILNFGENIDANLDAPDLFRKYCLPYYQRRLKQLKQAGKFVHVHMDGTLKPLLPFIREMAFDGIEAATPLPQGDVTLEELKEALGDKILLDGIPAVLFLRQYSFRELEAMTKKILELFAPRLILGISDEMPPDGDIEKVRLVSEIVQNFKM